MSEEDVPVRLSHLLRDCSVGAIVRGPDSLMVVQDTRTWDRPGSDPLDREIRYVDRVRKALDIEQRLCAPPRSADRGGTVVGWVPAMRFPTWTQCRDCGLLHSAPWRSRRGTGGARSGSETAGSGGAAWECGGCGGRRLEQMPWVLVHEEGYLADVPWHDLAHGGSRNPVQRQCARDWTAPYLRLSDVGDGRAVQCTRCGVSAGLPAGALPRLPFPPGTWQQPWVREPLPQSPEALAWMVEINDVRVHSSWTRGALVIPPESRIDQGTVTDRLYGSTKHQRLVRDARPGLAYRSAVKQLASEYRCAADDIEQAIAEIDNGYPFHGGTITSEGLLADEFQALTNRIPDLLEDEDFVTNHHTDAWVELRRSLAPGFVRRAAGTVSRLVAVNRLKEILVLQGFRRAGAQGRPTPPDLTGESPWLPALELYGEGRLFHAGRGLAAALGVRRRRRQTSGRI